MPFLFSRSQIFARLCLCFCLCLTAWSVPGQAVAKVKKPRSTAPKPAPPAEVVTPPAPIPSAAGKPNVLLVIAEGLGAADVRPESTPNMERLKKKGVSFANAQCNAVSSNASRTSVLTGLLPATSGVFDDGQDWRRSVALAGKPTLPEYLRSQGFLTAAAGKVFHANGGGPAGRLAWWGGGRRGYEQDGAWERRFPDGGAQIPLGAVRMGGNRNGLDLGDVDWDGMDVPDALTENGAIAQWAAEFLSSPQERPFFLVVGLAGGGAPWYVPKKYWDAVAPGSVTVPEVKADDLEDVPDFPRQALRANPVHEAILKADRWKEAARAHLAAVGFCDAMLGRVLSALEKSPHAGNTIVVFTSDHGYALGQKEAWGGGNLWAVGTHVPLTLSAPGVTGNAGANSQPVGLVDVFPTLCELLQVPPPGALDGTSLLPLMRDGGGKAARPAITMLGGGGKGESFAACTERWRYIRYADGSEELYDHESDPQEWRNLAAAPEHAALKKDLAAFFPVGISAASRPAGAILGGRSPNGGEDLLLQAGDELSAEDAPRLEGRGIFIDAAFEYVPSVDQNSTLLAQGDAQMGYALHMADGRPTLTLFADGRSFAIAGDTLAAGRVHVRASVDGEGLLSLAVPGRCEVMAPAPFPGGFLRQPAKGLAAGTGFGILDRRAYPDSTPFDGRIQRLHLTVWPAKGGVDSSGKAGSVKR